MRAGVRLRVRTGAARFSGAMQRRRRIELALNLATMTMLALALGMWIRGLPGGGSGAEAGKPMAPSHIPDSVTFEALASGDTLRLEAGGPALYLVFRSTCPVCGKNLRFWRGIVSRLPETVQAFAVALEGRESGRSYASRHLKEAFGVRPLEELDFIREFGVFGVPATLLVDASGRVTLRRTGLLDSAAVTDVLRAARTASSR
jgi:hypothetical protein